MAGLLGDSIDDPRTMALFAGIQGLLGGRGTMQGISQGLLNYGGTMQQAKQQAAQEEERKRRAEMQALQMQQQQMVLEQAKQAQAKQAAIEGAYRGAIRSPEQMAMAANGGPTIAAANAAPNASPGIDQQALIRGLSQADPMAAFQMLQPKQKEISRIEQMQSPDGKGLVNVAIYKDGSHQVMPYGVKPEMVMQDLGGKLVAMNKNALPNGATFDKSMTPGEKASNSLGWANNTLSRERLNLDRESAGGVDYKQGADGSWVALPKKPTAGAPIQANPVQGLTPPGQKDANDALAIIKEARALIPNATGSAFGYARDQVLSGIGQSTTAGDNAGKLKALEGALVAKMPKMSGPQSDKDVAMYRQMAAEIGNPLTPASRRLAALDTLEGIQKRYAGQSASAPTEMPDDIAAILKSYNNPQRGR